jgi:hypothetical protein
MTAPGFLAIWSDIPADTETDYLHWLTREHTAERLGVPGFRSVRVFRALRGDVCRYFILYALESQEVLRSNAYAARLNAPTPWSTRIMPQLGNFVRGGGHVAAAAGAGRGAFLAALPFAEAAAASAMNPEEAVQADRVTGASLLEVDQAGTSIMTRERQMRGGDASFARLLLVEGLDGGAVSATAARFLPPGQAVPLYGQVFLLAKEDLPS